MQTLIPEPVTNIAHPVGRRFGRALGFGLTPRALLLLAAATLLSIPAFLHAHTPWLMFGVDALLVIVFVVDAVSLPAPERFTVSRRFVHAPELGRPVEVELTVHQACAGMYRIRFVDDLHASMHNVTSSLEVVSYPNDTCGMRYTAVPSQRGDLSLGNAYLRFRSVLGFVERWSEAGLWQTVRVYAAGEQASDSASIYLLRARQIEMEKRRLRRIGLGREFETMRDYQPGDEVRNISWTATARHNRLITQQFTTERSQQVWIVIDAGRLSRTAYRMQPAGTGKGDRDAVHVVTQLDQAASAAGLLARVVGQSGDKLALLTYGRGVQQQLLPGAGHLHLRRVLDALSQVRSEAAEADHLLVSTRLRQLQRRRGLVLWITEMTESVGRPEIVAAMTTLVRRHLVVLVLLQHPELSALVESDPANAREMYSSTAAQEMLEQRRSTLATLRAQGVLVVETTAAAIASDSISQYLEIKAQGRL